MNQPTPAPFDLDGLLAQRIDEMKKLQGEAAQAREFLAQAEQRALRLDGQMALLVEMGGRHPEIVPPPPTEPSLTPENPGPGSAAEPGLEP